MRREQLPRVEEIGNSMKIGLIDIDSKIPNIALMKLSTFHKAKGHEVEWWKGLLFHKQYDKVYASKVFDFTAIEYDFPKDVEIGGSGYDIKKQLPEEIEKLCPDYSIYPDCNYSIGFITRGCFRSCKFCKVPQKEGGIRFHQDIDIFKNPNGKHWVFLDNNILAYNKSKDILNMIAGKQIKTDFNQGMDIRLVDLEIARILSQIKWLRFLRFSFDHVSMESVILKGIKLLNDVGVGSYRLLFYVLIGYNSTEQDDLNRINILRERGCDIFAMPFNKKSTYQRKFARWVNHKAIFKSVKWQDYKN
jgi:hypothetical protein